MEYGQEKWASSELKMAGFPSGRTTKNNGDCLTT